MPKKKPTKVDKIIEKTKSLTWWYVYVLQSKKDNNWYTGKTHDLRERFREHNSGLVYSTTKRRPFDLIYYEACIDEDDASAREEYLISGMGKRHIKNRLKFYFNKNKKKK